MAQTNGMASTTRVAALLALLLTMGAGAVSADDSRANQMPRPGLLFQPNLGQADAPATFVGTGPGLRLSIAGADATLDFGRRAGLLRVRMIGADRSAGATGERQQRTRVNYYVGATPMSAVPTYERVRIAGAYPGIDVVYYGRQDRLEYDFVVAPGADASRIGFALDGARSVTMAGGALRIELHERTVELEAPYAFQERDGQREPVKVSYRIAADTVRFELGSFDPSRELVIDPAFVYATLISGPGIDYVRRVAMGPDGAGYLIGSTDSPSFPPATPALVATSGPSPGSRVAFLMKLDPTGTVAEYLTYWGGHSDQARDVAVDANGHVYVGGSTDVPESSLPGGFAPSPSGGNEGYVLRFDGTGALVYGTYLGGSGGDEVNGIDVDGTGRVWAAGFTNSDGPAAGQPWTPGVFPIRGATYQTSHPSGRSEGFVVKIDTTVTGDASLLLGTYFGGDPVRGVQALDADGAGNVYISGTTVGTGTEFHAGNGFRTAAQGRDAFLAKLDPGLQTLLYGTYIGGSGDENSDGNEGYALAVNDAGHAWVAGGTESVDFHTTPGAMQATLSSGSPGIPPRDGFLVRIDTTQRGGNSLVFSTLLGGNGIEYVVDLDVDTFGRAYVVGTVVTLPGVTPFPTSSCALQSTAGDDWYDVFLVRVNPSGTGHMPVSTMLGGDNGFGVAVSDWGSALVAGRVGQGMPTTMGAFQQVGQGDWDGFAAVVRASCAGVSNLSIAYDGPATAVAGQPVAYTAVVTNAGPDPASDIVLVQGYPYDASGLSVSEPGCVLDPIPATTFTCALSLDSGESRTITFGMTLYGVGTKYSGVQTDMQWPGYDPDLSDNTQLQSVTIGNPVADVAVTYAGPAGPVLAGQPVTYTAVATNLGPDGAPHVVLVFYPPSGATAVSTSNQKVCVPDPWPQTAVTCQLGAVAAGDSRTFTVTFTPHGTGSVTSGVQVGLTGVISDPDSSNDAASASLTLREPGADLSVTYTGPAGPHPAGQPVTYTATVQNLGPDPATVTLFQYRPASSLVPSSSEASCQVTSSQTMLCPIGPLAVGGTRTVTFTFTPQGSGTQNTGIQTVDHAPDDPDLSNNGGWIELTVVLPGNDLSIVASSSTPAPTPFVPFTITLTAENGSSAQATGVAVTAKLTGLKFVKNQASGCISKNAGHVTCPTFTLAPGASRAVAIEVVSIAPGPYLTTYGVSAVEPDPVQANNVGSITVVTPPNADLAISTAVVSGPAVVGQPITYTMTVANAGPSAATDLSARLWFNNGVFVPDMLTFVSASPGCVLQAAQRLVACTAPALASGTSTTFTVTVTSEQAMTLGTIAQTAAVESDLKPANNATSRSLTIAP